jgi:hypothetical protein
MRAMKLAGLAVAVCLALGCAGCTGFGGKREIAFKLAVYGVSLEWSSTVDGMYRPAAAEGVVQPAQQ